MSKFSNLGKNVEKLSEILEEYKKPLEEVKSILKIDGKTIKRANQEAQYQFYYDEKRAELRTIVDYLELRVKSIRGSLFRAYTENSPRELSEKAKDRYIDNESKFLDIQEAYLEARELYEKYCSIIDAFKSRGFALNNITKATIASVEENEL